MSIYLGSHGEITLQRKFGEGSLNSVVNTGDVNVTEKRLSWDFEEGQLITGDQIEIKRTDAGVLDFVAAAGWSNSTQQSSGKWFIHVDDIGGVRLYSSYANAVNGGKTNAIATATPSGDVPVTVTVENAIYRILGQVSSYELSTESNVVDITSLSDQFRSQYSGLMSGSGRISCAWDYRDTVSGSNTYEVPHYLLQLILRTQVGCEFNARLFLKTTGYSPSGTAGTSDDQIWYEVNGIMTSTAVQFTPGQAVDITANFITTGAIQLKVDVGVENQLLQEDASELLLDQDAASKLNVQTDE